MWILWGQEFSLKIYDNNLTYLKLCHFQLNLLSRHIFNWENTLFISAEIFDILSAKFAKWKIFSNIVYRKIYKYFSPNIFKDPVFCLCLEYLSLINIFTSQNSLNKLSLFSFIWKFHQTSILQNKRTSLFYSVLKQNINSSNINRSFIKILFLQVYIF